MKISDDDLLDIGTGKQMLGDFIPKILCHSTKNEFAVGKKYALKNLTTSLLILAVLGNLLRKQLVLITYYYYYLNITLNYIALFSFFL